MPPVKSSLHFGFLKVQAAFVLCVCRNGEG